MRSGRPATSARQPPVRGAPPSLRTSPRRAPSPRRSRALPTLPSPHPRASLLLALPMTPLATAPGAACAAPPARGLSRARARAPASPGPRPLLLPKRRVALVASPLRPPSAAARARLAPRMPPRAAGDPTRAPCSTSTDSGRADAPCRSISAPRLAQGAPGVAPARVGRARPARYRARLGLLGAFFGFVLAKPIANYSYDPATQPARRSCASRRDPSSRWRRSRCSFTTTGATLGTDS